MKQKYNILTVVSSDYEIFAKLFLRSLYDCLDIQSVEQIYVFDTSINEDFRAYLIALPKLRIVQTSISSETSTQLHDRGWQERTFSKTQFLLETLVRYRQPTIMVDCDCIFRRDIFPLLEQEFDIAVCYTDQSHFTKHLGSFFVAKGVESSIRFVSDWLSVIPSIDRSAKESPALDLMLLNSTSLKVLKLPESQVACLKGSDTAYIYHLKSGGKVRTQQQRLNQWHVYGLAKKYLTFRERIHPIKISLLRTIICEVTRMI